MIENESIQSKLKDSHWFTWMSMLCLQKINIIEPSAALVSLIAKYDTAAMRTCAVFPQENALPSAETEAAIDEGDHFCGPSQRHLDMARHIIRPFVGMRKIGIIIRHEAVDEALQVTTGARIGIFHNHQTTTGMTAEYANRAFAQARLKQTGYDR